MKFDVVRVVIMRLRKRRPLFDADKNHIHHKLMRTGLSQHQALVCILLLAVSYTLLNTLLTIICNLGMTYTLLIDVVLFFLFNYMVNKAVLQNDQLPFVVLENN